MVDGTLFYYVANVSFHEAKVRIYSSRTKTIFFEIFFSWECVETDFMFCWFHHLPVNFYETRIGAELIKYAINSGWNYTKDRQTITIEHGNFLVEELELEKL